MVHEDHTIVGKIEEYEASQQLKHGVVRGLPVQEFGGDERVVEGILLVGDGDLSGQRDLEDGGCNAVTMVAGNHQHLRKRDVSFLRAEKGFVICHLLYVFTYSFRANNFLAELNFVQVDFRPNRGYKYR